MMGLDDWIISFGLILVVVRQLRGRHLTVGALTWPVALVVWAAFEYLAKIPGYASDWWLTLVLAVIGLGLGLGAGWYTRVYIRDNKVMAKASAPAATLWIMGMVSRLAFGLVALNGGADAIGRLSNRLNLHSANTWPTALITMALCEVLSRTALLLVRHQKASRSLKDENPPDEQAPLSNAGLDGQQSSTAGQRRS